MKSVNKVTLLGNAGKDPEVKFSPQGTAIARFSIATNERYKDKSGEWQDKTEWHNLVAFARLAEIVGEYVKKGSKVYVEGKLRTSSWEDQKTGEKKYRTEIVAGDLVLLGEKGEREVPNSDRHDFARTPASTLDNQAITDDDLPF